jgi:hypothetical protein
MRVAGDWELKGPGDTRKGFLTPSRGAKSEDESLSGGLMLLLEARGLGAPILRWGVGRRQARLPAPPMLLQWAEESLPRPV